MGSAAYRIGSDVLGAHVAVRFGGAYVWGWPRGVLSRLNTFGPVGGIELAGEVGIGGSLWLEPYGGYEHVRLNQIGIDVPYFGVRIGGEVARLFADDGDG